MMSRMLLKSAVAAVLLCSFGAVGAASARSSTTVPMTEAECLARGGWWMSGGKCAYKSCKHDSGKTYSPGSTIVTRSKKYYMCDGVTGSWTRID